MGGTIDAEKISNKKQNITEADEPALPTNRLCQAAFFRAEPWFDRMPLFYHMNGISLLVRFLYAG